MKLLFSSMASFSRLFSLVAKSSCLTISVIGTCPDGLLCSAGPPDSIGMDLATRNTGGRVGGGRHSPLPRGEEGGTRPSLGERRGGGHSPLPRGEEGGTRPSLGERRGALAPPSGRGGGHSPLPRGEEGGTRPSLGERREALVPPSGRGGRRHSPLPWGEEGGGTRTSLGERRGALVPHSQIHIDPCIRHVWTCEGTHLEGAMLGGYFTG